MPEVIQTVPATSTFANGRQTWNSNDTILQSRIDEIETENAQYYERFSGSDKENITLGSKFIVSLGTGESMRNGSVTVLINGVYYLSNTDQTNTQISSDFHIGDTYIVIHDLSNGGSINIENNDMIGIYYQKVTAQ